MKEKKGKKDTKKVTYLKPLLTKHKKLRDMTASRSASPTGLGCTRF
jgi:hypothetical protein